MVGNTFVSKFDVVKFEGTGNFGLWQQRVKDLLVQQGLSKAFSGVSNKPKQMSSDDWEDLQAKAVSTIRLCLADEVMYHVIGDDSPAGVDPSLCGDSRTRSFIHFNAGQSHCFNTRCPGFVIVRSDIPLDGVFPKVSIPGKDSIMVLAYINRDEANRNWWLEVGNELGAVGFWPKVIFSGLGDLANYVEWGGEAFSLPRTNAPPMGGGSFPEGDTGFDGFFLKVSVLNEYGKTVNVDNTEEFADNMDLYEVRDLGYKGDYFGRIFLYGGPGGKA